ncbi:stalk domain-containing protein [Paenibacillus thalictri]|nr:stalk domain-containing protein [Paenibacillus thalictri]
MKKAVKLCKTALAACLIGTAGLTAVVEPAFAAPSAENASAAPLTSTADKQITAATMAPENNTNATSAPQASKETVYMLFYPGQTQAFVNGSRSTLDIPVEAADKTAYVPAKWLGEALGFPVKWNESTNTVQMITPKAFVEFDSAGGTVSINGKSEPFSGAGVIRDGRLLVRLDWLSAYIGYKATYNAEMKRYELLYVKAGSGQSGFYNDTLPNARPVALFDTNKDTYRIGEPVRYTDVSYDPDMDPISREWSNRLDAFFEPGAYAISLTVTDSKGNESETYKKVVTITNEIYLSPFDYKVYNEPVGTFVKDEEATLRKYLRDIPQLPNVVKHPADRPLIVSDSPETFYKKGFLYQESVNGKARLYADHVNGMNEKVQFAIIVRNPDPEKTVVVKTTNQGEVYPSIYANLIGNEASLEFLQGERKPESLAVGPGQTVFYKKMPDFYPGQGMNVIYDVETDGEVYFSFVAMDAGADLSSVGNLSQLEYTGNVRGTFDWSEVQWTVDARGFDKPSSLTIGDGTSDLFVTGADFYTKKESLNLGNYGVVYKIHIPEPRKMSVLLLPRGGVFKSPFKVNGKIVQVPASGVMMDYQGYTIIARTTGTEKSLDLEFTPAAGSAFPVDVIFYPLDAK